MPHGPAVPRQAIFFLTALLLCFAAPAQARRSAASDLSGTLLSVSATALSVQGGDGRAIALTVTPATWFLKNGLPVSVRDFAPGEAVQVRVGANGRAALVCDPETAAALDTQRGRPLTGMVLSCTTRLWIVQPPGNALPLPVCLSPHTAFSAAGAKTTAAAFGAGASVTVITRGLSNGLLSAVSVSGGSSASDTIPKPRPAYLSGTVLEVRADLNLLTFQDKSGSAQTIAVDTATRVKVRKQPASLTDISAGMHLTGRLGAKADTAGNLIATSLSASDAPPEPNGKLRR